MRPLLSECPASQSSVRPSAPYTTLHALQDQPPAYEDSGQAGLSAAPVQHRSGWKARTSPHSLLRFFHWQRPELPLRAYAKPAARITALPSYPGGSWLQLQPGATWIASSGARPRLTAISPPA